MDYAVMEVLGHLNGQLSDPAEFFEAVSAEYEEHKDSGFEAFRSGVESRGLGPAGDELIGYLDEHERLDLVEKIVAESPADLAAVYWEQQSAEPSGGDGPEAETAWQAMLTEYSVHWDGDEQNWPAFEQYVVYYAEERGLAEPARRFFDRAATEDKRTLFAEYGIELPPPAAEPQAAPAAGDGLWQQAVDRFGPQWAAWDGTDSGWAEYRDWFYTATNSVDPDMYAEAYERMNPLDGLAAEERIARLREFGFDVTGTEVLESLADLFDEGGVFETAMDGFREQLPALADQLGLTVEELQARVDELGEDFFKNLITEESVG